MVFFAKNQKAYAEEVVARLAKEGFRVELDDRQEKIGYKIREAQLSKVPYMLVIGDKEMEARFVKEAEANGLTSLKGHRSVGGMRASIYNAMPLEGVKKLVAFMEDFETRHK